MQLVGEHYLAYRRQGRTVAVKQLIHDIMANFSVLVPNCMSFEQVVKTTMDLEQFLKDNPDQTTEQSPMELFSEFLEGTPEATEPDDGLANEGSVQRIV